jgi:predicted aldo/keto reductase-like oxidoreductase
MATRRKEVFLATKIPDRTRDDFMRRLEGSLKRLQLDQVDLVHIHSLRWAEDLSKLEAPDGALKGLFEAREQKMTRFVGLTSHTDGETMKRAIERHDLDCVQITLNPTLNGRFEELALPAAKKKNLGVIAMKVTGQELLNGDGTGQADVPSLLRYSMSLPVATAVIGMPKMEFINRNVEVARTFSPLKEEEMHRLRDKLAVSRKPMEEQLTELGYLDGPTRTPEAFWV